MRDQAAVHRISDSVFFAVCDWDAVMEARQLAVGRAAKRSVFRVI
jgi:hypothetical protein